MYDPKQNMRRKHKNLAEEKLLSLRDCLINPLPASRSTVGRVADPPLGMRCRLSEATYKTELFRITVLG
jgi:hypothetical protein